MLNELIQRHKIITVSIVLVFLALIVYGVYIALSRAGKEPVPILAVPGDATIMIDDMQYRPGTAYIKPGTYNVVATREGFETNQSTVTIGQPNTAVVDISLTPVSEEAKQWAEDNSDQYKEFQVRTGVRANKFGEEMAERLPITTHLPTGNYIYFIGHHLKDIDDPTAGIVLEINAITGYRQAALDKIRELGFDPTDYEIQFNNYENPFTS